MTGEEGKQAVATSTNDHPRNQIGDLSAPAKQSRERYQALFDNVPSGVVVYHPIDDGQDFIIADFNKAAARIEGVNRKDIIGRKVTEVFPGVKDLGLFDVFKRVHQTGQSEDHPIGMYKDERRIGWRKNYVYRFSTGEIVAVYNDETDRIQAGEAFQESELRFRSMVETTGEHVFIVDRSGRYVFSNDNVGAFRSSPDKSLIGKTIYDLHPPELARRYHQLVNDVFDTSQSVTFEHELEEEGEMHAHIDTLSPIFKSGQVWAVSGICHDITRLKRYERDLQQKNAMLENALQELQETQQQFVDQERQRALSQMACGIAHDFNNFLSLIQGYTDLLLESPGILEEKDTVKRYFSMINTAVGEATRVVRRLRQFYRPGDDGEEIRIPVDFTELIEEAIDLTKPKWEQQAMLNNVTVRIEKQLDHVSPVSGDRTELSEVLTNLIFNAVDAMPGGGVLRFCTREDESRIVLEVSDTGMGMDATVREQCLIPFYTTKGEAGSGLGLAAVQGIVVRHGGRLDIQSTVGQGTTFQIHLPVAGELDKRPVEGDNTSGIATGLKILIIDDEKPLLEMLAEYLARDNHKVETAVNGMEGLQKFNNDWFDLIITDLAMPGIGGESLSRQIKTAAPEKPVIILTGFGDMLTAEDKKREYADLVLSKPVTMAALREAISRLMMDTRLKAVEPG